MDHLYVRTFPSSSSNGKKRLKLKVDMEVPTYVHVCMYVLSYQSYQVGRGRWKGGKAVGLPGRLRLALCISANLSRLDVPFCACRPQREKSVDCETFVPEFPAASGSRNSRH